MLYAAPATAETGSWRSPVSYSGLGLGRNQSHRSPCAAAPFSPLARPSHYSTNTEAGAGTVPSSLFDRRSVALRELDPEKWVMHPGDDKVVFKHLRRSTTSSFALVSVC
jgi:hypothetical protein